jgi:pentatricopeptide repeat protein
LGLGRVVHDDIVRDGLHQDGSVSNALIDMYAKCGSLEESFGMLHRFPERDAVSWGALLSGYVQHGYDPLVFGSFCRMKEEGIGPSKVTYLCVLKACANLSAISHGWFIHDQVLRNGFRSDLEIGNLLVDLYAKCGMPDAAERVFVRLPKQDVVSWGALVAGYAQAREFDAVMRCLDEMEKKGFEPNDVIFTSIFAACSHAGSMQEARRYFRVMVERFRIKPTVQHYSCLIDLFGRAGHLKEAEQFFEIMPLPLDGIAWKSLLTSCKTHGSVDLGQACFDRGIELDPEDATNYELLSSLYADVDVHKPNLI